MTSTVQAPEAETTQDSAHIRLRQPLMYPSNMLDTRITSVSLLKPLHRALKVYFLQS